MLSTARRVSPVRKLQNSTSHSSSVDNVEPFTRNKVRAISCQRRSNKTRVLGASSFGAVLPTWKANAGVAFNSYLIFNHSFQPSPASPNHTSFHRQCTKQPDVDVRGSSTQQRSANSDNSERERLRQLFDSSIGFKRQSHR